MAIASPGEKPWALATGKYGARRPTLPLPHYAEDFLIDQYDGPPLPGNGLLRALSPSDARIVRPLLEHVELIRDQPIFDPFEPASHVWFPDVGMISIVALGDEGSAVEVATVGREGMTGLAPALGSDAMVYAAMVQVSGQGWRMESSAFRHLMNTQPTIKALMLKYVLAALTQMGQNAACAQTHALGARCARWLLLAHDYVDGDVFALTQDYLAMMLGVTRPSVSAAASELQRFGLIRYSRGQMTILDRAGLEAASCECYGIVRREFDRLLVP